MLYKNGDGDKLREYFSVDKSVLISLWKNEYK